MELTALNLYTGTTANAANEIALSPSALTSISQVDSGTATVTTAAFDPYTENLTLTWEKGESGGGLFYDHDGDGTASVQTSPLTIDIDPFNPDATLEFTVDDDDDNSVIWVINLTREAGETPQITLMADKDSYNENDYDETLGTGIIITATADPVPLTELMVNVRLDAGGIGQYLDGDPATRNNRVITIAAGETSGTTTYVLDTAEDNDPGGGADDPDDGVVNVRLNSGTGYLHSDGTEPTGDGNRDGNVHDTFTITDEAPTAAVADPDSPTLTVGNAAFTVSWMTPDSSGALVNAPTGYEICAAATTVPDSDSLGDLVIACEDGYEGAYTRTPGASATSVTIANTDADTTITNNIEYRVAIRSTHDDGNGSWLATTPATITPSSSAVTPTAPAAPTGVTATAGDASIDVSWTAVTGATSYEVCVFGSSTASGARSEDLDGNCGTDDTATGITDTMVTLTSDNITGGITNGQF